jgi:hypothetical protein
MKKRQKTVGGDLVLRKQGFSRLIPLGSAGMIAEQPQKCSDCHHETDTEIQSGWARMLHKVATQQCT